MRSLRTYFRVLLVSLLGTGSAWSAAEHPVYAPGKPFVVTGAEANGGFVDAFIGSVRLFRQDRVKVELVGHCYSSCTLYTALLKDGLLCARPGTVLGFHQYVDADDMQIEGSTLRSYRVKSPIRGQRLQKIMRTYPRHVLDIVEQAGGFPPHTAPLLRISAKRLAIPAC